MSLINQMLQDLEERRSGELVTASGHPRAAPRQRQIHRAWWGFGVILVVLIALGAWLLGRQFAPVPVSAAPPLVMLAPQQPVATPELPLGSLSQPLQVTQASQESPVAVLPSESSAQANMQANPAMPGEAVRVADTPPPTAANISTAGVPQPFNQPGTALDSEPKTVIAMQESRPSMPSKSVQASAPAPAPATSRVAPASSLPPVVDADFASAPQDVSKQVSQLTPQQNAENEYRRATVSMQQGKNAEAIAGLERALAIDSGHAAARQTLVGLLLGNRRQDEALRRLQEGLLLDRAQPGLAMLLARLQIEQGNLRPAIDTLQRSLPYASDRADYFAFLAALFQRDGRHKETIETYAVALRQLPQNGTWWMGLGISLQAVGRLPEARDAFFRAKETNTLAPELTAFVDQKLAQLR